MIPSAKHFKITPRWFIGLRFGGKNTTGFMLPNAAVQRNSIYLTDSYRKNLFVFIYSANYF
jgi:hypothetical protein